MAAPDNRRIAKNTLFLYFRMLLIMGVTLYTSRIVLNQLGEIDYGIYNVVGGIVVMFSFLNGAMAQATQRFLSYEMGKDNTARLNTIFSTAMTIHIIIAAGILILAETIGLWFLNSQMTIPSNRIFAANCVYQCSIASFIASIIQVPYNATIIAHEKMQAYAYISIIEVSLKLLAAISIAWFADEKLIHYAILILLVTIAINLSYQIYCKRYFHECHYNRTLYDKDLLTLMSEYAGWSTFGSLAWIGKSQGCNLILNVFLGPAVNAAYGITTQVNVALNSFVQNFTTALNPQIVKSYAANEYDRMNMLICYGAKLSFFLMLVLSVPILIDTNRILTLWLKDVPQYTVIFMQLVIINSLLETFTYCMSAAIQATGKIKTYQIIVGLTTLLNLPIAYITLKMGISPYYIFLASIIITVLTLAERLVIMKRSLSPFFSIRQFFGKVFVKSIAVIAIISIIMLFISYIIDICRIKLIVSIAASLFMTVVLSFLFGFSSTEKKIILNMVKSQF